MTAIDVTRHGEQRCRERLGVPRRAVPRTVAMAWDKGVAMRSATAGCVERLWRGARWIFDVTSDRPCFVTVMPAKEIDELRAGIVGEEIARTSARDRKRQRRRRAIRRRYGYVVEVTA